MNIPSTLGKALFLLIISTPFMLIILSIDHHPIAPTNLPLSENQIRDIQQLLINNDPRLLIDSDDQAIILNEDDVNSLIHYFKSEVSVLNSIALTSKLEHERIILDSSISIPSTPFGEFVNIKLVAKPHNNFLSIETLQIGQLTIPNGVIDLAFKLIRTQLMDNNNYQLLQSLFASVEKTSLSENQLNLTLNWQEDNIDNIQMQARKLFISAEERELIVYFQQQFIEITKTIPEGVYRVDLSSLTKPMFQRALLTENSNNDPITENRAIFIVLLTYLTDLTLENFIGPLEQYALDTPPNLLVVIEGREDLSQHVMGSALIASTSSSRMANIVSVYKEVHDSRYRTGFSFSDITANQVGSMIGTISSQNSSSAERLQSLMSQATSNGDFMPLVGTNDGLSEAEFIEVYESRESAKFIQRISEINHTISQLSFFQQLLINE